MFLLIGRRNTVDVGHFTLLAKLVRTSFILLIANAWVPPELFHSGAMLVAAAPRGQPNEKGKAPSHGGNGTTTNQLHEGGAKGGVEHSSDEECRLMLEVYGTLIQSSSTDSMAGVYANFSAEDASGKLLTGVTNSNDTDANAGLSITLPSSLFSCSNQSTQDPIIDYLKGILTFYNNGSTGAPIGRFEREFRELRIVLGSGKLDFGRMDFANPSTNLNNPGEGYKGKVVADPKFYIPSSSGGGGGDDGKGGGSTGTEGGKGSSGSSASERIKGFAKLAAIPVVVLCAVGFAVYKCCPCHKKKSPRAVEPSPEDGIAAGTVVPL